MDLIVGPESVTISIKSCLRRRSGIFTHLPCRARGRSGKHILVDELRACMTHRDTFLNWLRNRASGYFPINDSFFVAAVADAQLELPPVGQTDQERGSRPSGVAGGGFRMKLDPDSDLPPHEWRRRRQTCTRSANGASFAANMLGVRLSRQLIPNNAKLPFLPPLEQCGAGKSDFPVWSECFPNDLNSQLHFSPKTAKYSWEHLTIPNSIETRSKLFRMMLSWLKHIFVHVTTPWPGIKAITLPEMTCATSHTFKI